MPGESTGAAGEVALMDGEILRPPFENDEDGPSPCSAESEAELALAGRGGGH